MTAGSVLDDTLAAAAATVSAACGCCEATLHALETLLLSESVLPRAAAALAAERCCSLGVCWAGPCCREVLPATVLGPVAAVCGDAGVAVREPRADRASGLAANHEDAADLQSRACCAVACLSGSPRESSSCRSRLDASCVAAVAAAVCGDGGAAAAGQQQTKAQVEPCWHHTRPSSTTW